MSNEQKMREALLRHADDAIADMESEGQTSWARLVADLRAALAEQPAQTSEIAIALKAAAQRGATPAEVRSQRIGYVSAETGASRETVEALLIASGRIPEQPAQGEAVATVNESLKVRQSFEGWLAKYSTLSAERDQHGYCDMTVEMLSHAYAAGMSRSAPSWPTYEAAAADLLFHQARGIMGTANIGQDRALREAILHVFAAYTSPPAPSVPEGWGLAAFQHKWEACETQCECKVCGTVFGAVPGPTVPPVSSEQCSHARTFNGRLCCDCGAEVDPATQNFGRYGTAPPAPAVPALPSDPPPWWAASLNRRAAIEAELFDMASGKRPLPDAARCRAMALELGVPDEFRARLKYEPAPAVSVGWKLVPVEPTDDMEGAACHELRERGCPAKLSDIQVAWSVMLAATPEVKP